MNLGSGEDYCDGTPTGWWTCFLCQPNVHDHGGQPAWMAHYMRGHYHETADLTAARASIDEGKTL